MKRIPITYRIENADGFICVEATRKEAVYMDLTEWLTTEFYQQTAQQPLKPHFSTLSGQWLAISEGFLMIASVHPY